MAEAMEEDVIMEEVQCDIKRINELWCIYHDHFEEMDQTLGMLQRLISQQTRGSTSTDLKFESTTIALESETATTKIQQIMIPTTINQGSGLTSTDKNQ